MTTDPGVIISILTAGRDGAIAASVSTRTLSVPRGGQVIRSSKTPEAVYLVCQGFAKAHVGTVDGARQTLALYVPGDVFDLGAFLLGQASVETSALTPMQLAAVPCSTLRSLIDERRDLALALWRRLAMQHALLQEWTVGLGRRLALARTAHLICEVSERLSVTSPSDDLPFPLTQVELADVLGLSPVHVNRVLQQLKGEGLIEIRNGHLRVCNRPRLIELGDFDPTYLRRGDGEGPR
ncbi:MAG: Crp/Fnr family transcriptional regulator [Caulobacteraceae bacterium]|nr:Crp/Fnr family transcriptional regulator [Caulobacteraceae bacterium]